MITEDYVSLETAKFLKERGFNEICDYEYGVPVVEQGYVLQKFFKPIKNSELIDEAYAAPTLQMAMKWLREVHHLHCAIGILYKDGKIIYFPNVDSTECSPELEEEFVPEEYHSEKYFHSYEESCEAAIKYCLENLI